uniref:Anticodon-binding domain-containing protein n=1 Tax=Clastoptera arizonana TaxID=38151 RepID=A0A1B6DQ67_9HEMI
MMNTFPRILELCELNGFLKPVIVNGIVSYFKYGPLGELLAQNIRNEWIYSNVINRDENVYLHYDAKSGIEPSKYSKEAFKTARTLNNGHLPFGLATIREGQKQPLVINNESSIKYFHPSMSNCLKYTAFTSTNQGQQFFYRWQHQRKIWWRKFSADPGRFSLSEIHSESSDLETTHIIANFPWGNETLETITNYGTSLYENLSTSEKTFFEARDGNKKTLPYVVESVCSEGTSALTFLSDAYNEPTVMGSSKKVLRLHRKLAPYKICFAAAPTSNAVKDEIRLLATFLNKGLRKAGISTLLPSTVLAKKALESQHALNDSLGIPFTIVLSQTTLENGILGIRSRETTLEEQSHVSKLVSYIELLMKNY